MQGADHPRACGEHAAVCSRLPLGNGSSPRLRGTHHGRGLAGGSDRIIPAPAGNTGLMSWMVPSTSDHPRACGEHLERSISSTCQSGSSPRLRGTQRVHVGLVHAVRIIPAPAGNTGDRTRAVWVDADHPRACGEHFSSWGRMSYCAGSSPRLRGTR